MARAIYTSLFLSGTILVFVLLGPLLNPKHFSFRTAILFLLCGLVVTGITEWSREMLRKPYVVYNYLYSNAVLKDRVPLLRTQGFFASAPWANALAMPKSDSLTRGRLMFRFSCMSCHTVSGYRGMDRLLGNRNRQGIEQFLTLLQKADQPKNPYYGIMPPLIANPDEVQDLAAYLASLNGASKQPPPGSEGASEGPSEAGTSNRMAK
jgi:mono/diheme cytochrome c family protein